METITNVVNTVSTTATKAIWGEQPAAGNETAGKEPVSGVQGEGTATEPYDQGNAVDPTDPTTNNETAGKEPVSGLQGKGTTSEPFDQGNSADATNPIPTGITSLPIREKSSSSLETPDLSAKPTIPTGDAFNSATAANASTAGQTSAITSLTEPETDSAGVSGTKNLSDTLSKKDTDTESKAFDGGAQTPGLAGFSDNRRISPDDTTQIPTEVTNVTGSSDSKPTTSSFDQPAGATGTQNLSDTLAKTDAPTLSPTSTPAVTGNEGGAPLGSAKGTGETHVKSTGVSAEGGDFDASTAGAGKEADRTSTNRSRGDSLRALLERADMVTGLVEEKSASKGGASEAAEAGEKEKVSKMEKLKEKLHIGHKH